jgi:hypothetical protein
MAAEQVKVALLRWGRVHTSDLGQYKDAIVHSRSEEWDWGRFGLQHDPGYTAEVLRAIRCHIVSSTSKEFRSRRPTIYLSTGIDQKIQVPNPSGDSQIVYLQSEACVAAYNADVQAGKACVLFLHSTC